MPPVTDTVRAIRGLFDSYQRQEILDPGLRRAAVLIPLFPENGELHVLLTRRTDEVEHHKGQISFPGGVSDPVDTGLVATALREAEEEIGLPRTQVEILGLLSDLSTPSGFNIAPVVGYVPSLPRLKAHPVEVAEMISVPLAFFVNPANEHLTTVERDGVPRRVYHYAFGPYDIWGATAAIVHMFVAALSARHIGLRDMHP
jgi:8-oxo-dGTP pyrophosphatase MutT (NUDIX family)